jgi:hypothetical protein
MSFLAGKSKSENRAFPWLQSTFGGTSSNLVQQGTAGLGRVQDFLTGRDTTGFEQFRDSSGYQNIFNEAMRGVTSNAAARGLLSSGAMVRTAQDRAGELARQQYDNYLQRLMGVSQAQMQGGQNLAQIIGGAGGVSEQRGGLGDAIGGIGAGVGALAKVIKSDMRLKDDITLIRREPDGLGIYKFRYKGEPEFHTGVMAQEVEKLRPHALGPLTEDGFMTVDYGKL